MKTEDKPILPDAIVRVDKWTRFAHGQAKRAEIRIYQSESGFVGRAVRCPAVSGRGITVSDAAEDTKKHYEVWIASHNRLTSGDVSSDDADQESYAAMRSYLLVFNEFDTQIAYQLSDRVDRIFDSSVMSQEELQAIQNARNLPLNSRRKNSIPEQ
ncbi:MAG: hypothetical protein JWP89_2727 [Schlesneria sp.]|nr:hypothetical protein [Schlesneria sp.]